MALAGAPTNYMLVNIAGLVVGIALFAGATLTRRFVERASGYLVLVGGVSLLATALFGVALEGASRWVHVGPVTVQPSLILLPAMLVLFARGSDVQSTVGLLLAAGAMAAQPDRAMAGVLLAALVWPLLARLTWRTALAFGGAAASFCVAMLREDRLPAVPYVDGILFSAFGDHPVAGAAIWAGAALLVVPALVAASRREPSVVRATFGAIWLAVVAAAALGNYPTPVVGYGASAIIGYLLSVAALSPGKGRRARTPGDKRAGSSTDRTKRRHRSEFVPA